jgi:hypothetical protein
LTAFLAHRRALRELAASGPEQSAMLTEMEALLRQLNPGEPDALDSIDSMGANARHRERAERHLTHILRQRGVLAE